MGTSSGVRDQGRCRDGLACSGGSSGSKHRGCPTTQDFPVANVLRAETFAEVKLPDIALKISRIQGLDFTLVAEQNTRVGQAIGCRIGRSRHGNLEIISSLCPGRARCLVEAQEENSLRAVALIAARTVVHVVVVSTADSYEPLVRRRSSGRASRNFDLHELGLSEYVAHPGVILVGELKEHLALACGSILKMVWVRNVQGKHPLCPTAHAASQNRAPFGADFGLSNTRNAIYVRSVLVTLTGQSIEVGGYCQGDISKKLFAVTRSHGMQHTIVGAKIYGRRAGSGCFSESWIITVARQVGIGFLLENGAGIDNVTHHAGAAPERIGCCIFLDADTAQIINTLRAQVVSAVVDRAIVQCISHRCIELGQIGGGECDGGAAAFSAIGKYFPLTGLEVWICGCVRCCKNGASGENLAGIPDDSGQRFHGIGRGVQLQP